MQHSQKTAAVILAAGTSSRMSEQRNKLLLPLRERPVLAHVLEAVLGSQARSIVIVLGHQANEVRTQILPYLQRSATATNTISIVENPDYRQGMSTSMQAGLRVLTTALNGQPDIGSVIFLLGDQPMITPAIIDRLIEVRERTAKRIVLPLYRGQRGNPVLFTLDLAPELLAVSGDEGGRSVITRHRDDIETVEMGEEEANIDVDTWEIYQKVLATWQ